MPSPTANKHCDINTAIQPLHPEAKTTSRKRRRGVSHSPAADLVALSDAMNWRQQRHDPADDADDADTHKAKRHHQHQHRCLSGETDVALKEEVASLQASVVSMEKQVALAARKVQELRDLVALFVQQQAQVVVVK